MSRRARHRAAAIAAKHVALVPLDDDREDDTDDDGGINATNGSGPASTYGCACMDRDSVQCAAIRYGMDHWGEACQCLCHQWSDDE